MTAIVRGPKTHKRRDEDWSLVGPQVRIGGLIKRALNLRVVIAIMGKCGGRVRVG